MWAHGNTKPLQGDRFWLFRSVLLGIPPDYDDDLEQRNTYPLLLPKAEAGEMIPKQDTDVLKRAMGSTDSQEHKKSVMSNLILPPVETVAKQRSVLDDNRYGPGNRIYWTPSRT